MYNRTDHSVRETMLNNTTITEVDTKTIIELNRR